MGACSAGILERRDAGRLIGVHSRWQAGVDIGDPHRSSGRGIKIGVEDAEAAAELELDAAPLAHLESGASEMADELRRGQSDELSGGCLRSGRSCGLNLRLRLARHAAGEEQWKSEDQAAHHPARMPGAAVRGNVAGARMAR